MIRDIDGKISMPIKTKYDLRKILDWFDFGVKLEPSTCWQEEIPMPYYEFPEWYIPHRGDSFVYIPIDKDFLFSCSDNGGKVVIYDYLEIPVIHNNGKYFLKVTIPQCIILLVSVTLDEKACKECLRVMMWDNRDQGIVLRVLGSTWGRQWIK